MATTIHPVHHLDDKHHFNREATTRLHSIIVFGLIGIGLAVCAFGAIVYDVGRLFSAW